MFFHLCPIHMSLHGHSQPKLISKDPFPNFKVNEKCTEHKLIKFKGTTSSPKAPVQNGRAENQTNAKAKSNKQNTQPNNNNSKENENTHNNGVRFRYKESVSASMLPVSDKGFLFLLLWLYLIK